MSTNNDRFEFRCIRPEETQQYRVSVCQMRHVPEKSDRENKSNSRNISGS